MLLLTEVILRLRATCPIFEQRVAGTQSFAAATSETSDIDVPCCFVVPMYDTATARSTGGPSQEVTERFATIVCADNSKDARHGRGMTAEMVLRAAKQELANALMNWTPKRMLHIEGITYARGQHLFMNNARIWHQFEWTAQYQLAPNEAAPPNDGEDAINAVIYGDLPEVNPLAVRSIRTNTVIETLSINPNDPTTWEEVFHSETDTNQEWIRYKSHVEDPGLQEADPDDVLYSGERTLEP